MHFEKENRELADWTAKSNKEGLKTEILKT